MTRCAPPRFASAAAGLQTTLGQADVPLPGYRLGRGVFPVPAPGLNGKWRGNDKGDYYLRQIGNEVRRVGLDSTTNGTGWTHAFRGYRTGNTIKGSWADVRGNVGRGMLTLNVQGLKMTRTATSNANFGGSTWIKRC